MDIKHLGVKMCLKAQGFRVAVALALVLGQHWAAIMVRQSRWMCRWRRLQCGPAGSGVGGLPHPDLALGYFPATMTRRKGPRPGGCYRWASHLSSGLLTCPLGTRAP